ncbi:CmcJ/NvfI family oxidoreductase [Aurantiacibacter poecillastricola]|uniref:CmcJ/NvfI family oxidoreductase n=1 Tax=Aurantiacibacter poecillastricola TaxID=3064385 RepID=UPI00273EE9FD|nr:CmcJ/NvfI family oxidoreductase [Aurantiacibacter sp. 219JJ12-13]MDP5260645.1 CmcJ/NvfI family oxidoreductase [Aurantiacibacter sp. 219JJ12-13]
MHTQTAVHDVTASIRYIVRGEKATFYAGDRDRSYWPGEDHLVTVHDIRQEVDALAFDRNGFVVLEEASPVADYDADGALDVYSRYAEQTVQRLTGAAKVVSFGVIRRTSATGTHGHNQPANGAHVDYGAKTIADYTRLLLPEDEAQERLSKRHMLFNLWRPITSVESAPFALCDASTVKRQDLFPSEIVGGLGGVDFSLWGFNLAYDPGHRWCWLPHQRPEQMMVFKLFDTDDDAVQFTAHTSFNPPGLPDDAAPRQSIELRTIAYFD